MPSVWAGAMPSNRVTTDAFEEAKKQITDRIMPAALEASTTQSIRILRLSDLVDLMNPDPDPAKAAQRAAVALGKRFASAADELLVAFERLGASDLALQVKVFLPADLQAAAQAVRRRLQGLRRIGSSDGFSGVCMVHECRLSLAGRLPRLDSEAYRHGKDHCLTGASSLPVLP